MSFGLRVQAMTDVDRTERYTSIIDRCLEREDKDHRDQVLSEYPENVQRIVRGQMGGIAKRLASYIRAAGERERNLDRSLRRQKWRQRLEAIHPPWLRERVKTMASEKWQQVERDRRAFRESVR